MGKLVVKLPGIRQSMRVKGMIAAEESEQKKSKSSKERVKAFREKT